MRTLVTFLLISLLQSAGLLNRGLEGSTGDIRIERLVVVSDNLSTPELHQLDRCFHNALLPPAAIQSALRSKLRDLGYFKAVVGEPEISGLRREGDLQTVKVSVKAIEGDRYRLGVVTFTGSSVFTSDLLRQRFNVRLDDLFSPTKIGQGLEGLRAMYAAEGYINFVATPGLAVDETSRRIDLAIQLDEGHQVYLGGLTFEGIEPHAGAMVALRETWGTLQGKRYDPGLLDRWLELNRLNCPGCTRTSNLEIVDRDSDSHVVSFRLALPNAPTLENPVKSLQPSHQ